MTVLNILVAVSLTVMAVVNAAAPAPAPQSASPRTADSNSNSTLTSEIIDSTWVLYTGSALNGFKNVVFTKLATDPSNRCYLIGYYEPAARNATTAVDCFLDLQALIVYAYQQGLKIYYTGTMYLAGPEEPENDCAVICRSVSSDSSAAAPIDIRHKFSGYGLLPLVLVASKALVLVSDYFYELWTSF